MSALRRSARNSRHSARVACDSGDLRQRRNSQGMTRCTPAQRCTSGAKALSTPGSSSPASENSPLLDQIVQPVLEAYFREHPERRRQGSVGVGVEALTPAYGLLGAYATAFVVTGLTAIPPLLLLLVLWRVQRRQP